MVLRGVIKGGLLSSGRSSGAGLTGWGEVVEAGRNSEVVRGLSRCLIGDGRLGLGWGRCYWGRADQEKSVYGEL